MVAVDVLMPNLHEETRLADVLGFIEAHEQRRGSAVEPTYFLAGTGEHDHVELTEQLHAVLKQVVHALSRGQSVSILARDREVSTQQAAEILGVSRPTVVRLIEEGDLPAYVPGSVRRKLRLVDVLEYREVLRERRNEFIGASSAAYDDSDPDEVARLLTAARKAT